MPLPAHRAGFPIILIIPIILITPIPLISPTSPPRLFCNYFRTFAPMTTLHIFNPSHDEALAAGTPRYTPTRAARRMEEELWDFPTLWAAAADRVTGLGRRVQAVEWDEVERVEPWGWDLRLCAVLRKFGAPERLLPTDAALAALRRLSSRETTVRLLPLLRREVEGTVGEARFCRTMAELRPGDVLKAPWSCSGRGVFRFDGSEAALRRAARIIARQGAIEAETYVAHTADFAMEFGYAGGRATYEGLSLFRTSPTGLYGGNVVAPEADLLSRLAGTDAGVRGRLDAVRTALVRLLPDVLGANYEGPLGVDMMLLPDGRIHPCVELNLRRTMGSVALRLRARSEAPCLLTFGERDGRLAPLLLPLD